MLNADELLRRGRAAINAGRLTEGSTLLSRALARAPDQVTRARALIGIALVDSERGTGREGLATLNGALEIPDLPGDVRGLALSQLGLLHMRSGDRQAALSAFAEAEPLLSDDQEAVARLLMNRGYVRLQGHQLNLAVRDFERAQALSQDPVERAKAEHNRGYAEYLAGNLVAALQLIEQAALVLGPLSPTHRATLDSDLAEVLSACGLSDEAVGALEQAAHAFALRRLRQSQAEAELARARILVVTDPARAAPVARQAARRFRLRGSEEWALRADAVGFAAGVRSGRSGPAVLRTAETLQHSLLQRRLRADAQVVALEAARAALSGGDHLSARTWGRRARVAARDPLPTRLLDREVRARLAAERGRRRTAYDHLRCGLDELHEWLSAFGSLELQAALVGQGRTLAARGLAMAVADGRPELVFEWFERARVLVTRVTPVRPPDDEQAAMELAELRRRQELGEDVGALRDRIRQHAWHAPSIGPAARPASLAQLQAALGEAAMLGLVVADGRIHALLVTAERAEVVPVGLAGAVLDRLPALAADLDMAASDLPAGLGRVVRLSLRSQLASLDAALVSPVAERLGERPVLVVASGALAAVPWSLLPSLAGRPVSVARSATHWLAARDAEATLGSVGFVTGPGVPRAEEEVRRSAAVWAPGSVDTVIDASAAQVSDLAGRVDVLHVAAHGRHSAENPLFSGIELTGGPWFGYDIDQLAALPAVVLLSACELGRSAVRGGEQLVGMTTAWLHAGVRCVVASPAAVNDDLACELLPLVHRELAAGRPPAVALATAGERLEQVSSFSCYGAGW